MGNHLVKLKSYAALAAFVLWSLVPLGLPAPALAAAAITGSNSYSGTYGTATPINNLQLTDTGNPTEQVRLTVSSGTLAMTTTTGLTFTGGSTGAQLKFSGTLSNVNAALATLAYTRTAASVGTDSLEVTLVGANQVYNPTNGHLYEYVTSDGARTWTAAKALADARTSGSATGYLATMTSAEENTYISDRLTGAGWMGASDIAVEGAWRWVDGPETGLQFWSGLAANNGIPGAPVGGQYNNWNSGEPNQSGEEDCGQFLSGTGGQWNDLPCTVTTLAGYVVEYGAPGSLPEVASKSIALTTTSSTRTISSCAQLQTIGGNTATRFDTLKLTSDIDCTGVTFVPMYTGSLFEGVFDGQGHAISNLTVNRPSTNYAGLFAASSGIIKNVTLESGSVTGLDYTGGLIGEVVNGATISNVVSKLSVTGRNQVGGMVGSLYTGTAGSVVIFENSSVTGNVTGTDSRVGGFIGIAAGDNSTTTFSQVFTTGNVTAAGDFVGGLIGLARTDGSSHASSILVKDAYTHGSVTSPTGGNAGGMVGYMQSYGASYVADITLQRTYASGAVSAAGFVGGLIGATSTYTNANSVVSIDHSFAAGHLSSGSTASLGGLVGYNDMSSPYNITSAANYYDGPGTGVSVCAKNTVPANCMNIDTVAQPNYFKSNHLNAPMSAWNFSTIWVVNVGSYPTFMATDDNDNIDAATENAGPNLGDANGDGTLDSLQPSVASMLNPASGSYTVLQTSCGSLYNVQVGAESTVSGQTDVAYSYPGGLLKFTAIGCTPGTTATITQYFYGLSNPSQFVMRKWNSANITYTTIPGATFATTLIGGQAAVKAAYQIADGGPFDQDGTANGDIVDPAGPAVNVLGVPNTGLGGRVY